MKKISLVLEGGGLRGIYTSAILDFMLEKGIEADYAVGVSAGAIMSASYFSKQPKRNLRINTKYLTDSRYMSFKNVVKEGAFFSKEYAYREIPNNLEPFDYNEFYKNDFIYKVGCFDVVAGRNRYFDLRQISEREVLLDTLMASGSLPFLSKPVNLDNGLYLDGGIGDSIPLKEAIEDNRENIVVILTRHRGYRKKVRQDSKFIRFFYRKYPLVAKELISRSKRYNETIEMIEKLEKKGKVLVIRPSYEVEVGRLERDPDKIRELYKQGRSDMEDRYLDLLEYLK